MLPSEFESTACELYSRVRGIRVKGGTIFRGAEDGVLIAELALILSIYRSAGAGAGPSTDFESPECRVHENLFQVFFLIFVYVPHISGFLF